MMLERVAAWLVAHWSEMVTAIAIRRMRILSVADATRLAPCIGAEVECVLSENFHSSSAGA